MPDRHSQPSTPPLSRQEKELALLASELDYFRAGSQAELLQGGELFCLAGFENLAGGCVLHNIVTGPPEPAAEQWLDTVEARFEAIGADFYRLYFVRLDSIPDIVLTRRGYQPVLEKGLVCQLDPSKARRSGSSLRPVADESAWHARRELYRLASTGPDGHDTRAGRFSELEKIKQQTGYMTSYLYHVDDFVVGAVSLAVKNGFARLKNLLVHPDYRGRGIGKQMVSQLKLEALEQGAVYLGAYAADRDAGFRTYLASGMREVTQQQGWTRLLGTGGAE